MANTNPEGVSINIPKTRGRFAEAAFNLMFFTREIDLINTEKILITTYVCADCVKQRRFYHE